MTTTQNTAAKFYKRYCDLSDIFRIATIEKDGCHIWNGSEWEHLDKQRFLEKMAYYSNTTISYYYGSSDSLFDEINEEISKVEQGYSFIVKFGGEPDWVATVQPGQDPHEAMKAYTDEYWEEDR